MLWYAFLCVACTAPAAAQLSNEPAIINIALRLEAESPRPRAGSTVAIALVSEPRPGWHGYWRNPGDAGFAPEFRWSVGPGVHVSAPAWPVPSTLLVNGLMNYVYEAPYVPLVELTVPAGLEPGTKLPIKVHARYLACTREICLPETNEAKLVLVVGDGKPTAADRFDRWRRRIPMPLGSEARWSQIGTTATFDIPYPASAPLDRAYLFPITSDAFDPAAPQRVTRDGDRLRFVIMRQGKDRKPLDAVLRIAPDRGLMLRASYGTIEPGAPPASGMALTWLAALAGALLGGLLLNLMPCVFPILSLKALALTQAGAGERTARREALGYAAGVMAVTIGLGLLLLVLRAGGKEVGWAFQLQSASVVTLLLLLSAAIGLNLAGLFELPTPSFARGIERAGAFATGALTAFVATPCSGPFMATALGSALVLPWPSALAIFAGLGLGLSLPYLLIGFVPLLRARLPRPGPWMGTMRRVLAIPMLLTAAALAWLLGRLAGIDAQATGALAVLCLGLLLWLGGLRQLVGKPFGWPVVAGLLVTSVGASLFVGAMPVAPSVTQGTTARSVERFSEPRLAELTARGKPVFVYFTADWCLTCKVNERTSIDRQETRDAFSKADIAVLRGDWTSGDPAIGRFIAAHHRAGVPLYVFYKAGAAPRILPQVLTPGMLTQLAGS